MDINKNDTAVVFIDPQNKVLSDKGLAWGSVGDSKLAGKVALVTGDSRQGSKTHYA